MPNFGEIQDHDTNGTALLPLDLNLYESTSLTPRTTMHRLLPALDVNGNAHADTIWNSTQRYEWISLPTTNKDYDDNIQHATVLFCSKKQEYNDKIDDDRNKIIQLQSKKVIQVVTTTDIGIFLAEIKEEQKNLKEMSECADNIQKNKNLLASLTSYESAFNTVSDTAVFKIEYQHDSGGASTPLVAR